jgi:hypothetical protein
MVTSYTKQTIREDVDTITIFIRITIFITPKQVVNVFDLGYLGIEKDFPGHLSAALPYKKRRNQQELPAEEKDYNKYILKKEL